MTRIFLSLEVLKDRLRQLPVISTVMVAGVFFVFYLALFMRNTPTDVQAHVVFAQKMANGEAFIGNFLFFLTVVVLSFGSVNFKVMLVAAIIIIVVSIALKYSFTQRIIAPESEIGSITTRPVLYSCILALVLIVTSVINIPGAELTRHFIVGQLPPNVWHNSTTIFLMPFALLLFYRSAQLLHGFTRRHMRDVIILVALNALIKPSFLLCFIIIYPVFAFSKHLLKPAFWRLMIPVFVSLLMILAQYFITFYFSRLVNVPDQSEIKLSPFNVWSKLSDSPALSLLISFVYPFAFLLLYFRKATKQLLFNYAWALFLISVLIFILLSETGEREFHGNFLWQGIVCNFILFMMTLVTHLKIIADNRRFTLPDRFIFGLLLLHFIAGLLYLIKFFVLKKYH